MWEDGDNRVLLMTLHSAKGLEFPWSISPAWRMDYSRGFMTIASDDPLEIEEERRLGLCGNHQSQGGSDADLCQKQNAPR